jgi:hypothetical protein
LRCRYDRWSLICTVAAKLHNFCIEENIGVCARHFADIEAGDSWEILNNNLDAERQDYQDEGGRSSIRPTGNRRKNITNQLDLQGITRPRHAFANSKA